MDPRSLAIPLAFILLSALMCFLLIGTKRKWWLKLILILVVPSFGIAVWGAMGSFKGWPTTAEPPEKALLLWAVVREPDQNRGDPGAIYLWLLPFDESASSGANPLEYVPPNGEPRAYKFPYSRGLHKMAQKGVGMVRQGKPAVFERKGHNGQGDEDGEGDGDDDADGRPGQGSQRHRGNGNGGLGREDPDAYEIYELPPPQMVPKGPPQ